MSVGGSIQSLQAVHHSSCPPHSAQQSLHKSPLQPVDPPSVYLMVLCVFWSPSTNQSGGWETSGGAMRHVLLEEWTDWNCWKLGFNEAAKIMMIIILVLTSDPVTGAPVVWKVHWTLLHHGPCSSVSSFTLTNNILLKIFSHLVFDYLKDKYVAPQGPLEPPRTSSVTNETSKWPPYTAQ